jgi:hypothetical protein
MKVLIFAALFVLAVFFVEFSKRTNVIFEKQYIRPSGCENSYEEISKADALGKFTFAYFEYCNIGSPPDKRYIEIILRSIALSFDAEVNKKILRDIQNTDVDLPAFFEIASDAIIWAEVEKAKTPEELYKISTQIPEAAKQNNYIESYRLPYLLLAHEKGHMQATKDLQELEKNQAKYIQAIQKSLGTAH